MSRSLKKGPYTFPRLLNRVRELNEKGKKEVIIQNSLVIHLLFTMDVNLYQYMLLKIW